MSIKINYKKKILIYKRKGGHKGEIKIWYMPGWAFNNGVQWNSNLYKYIKRRA